jgi:competence CoiA-like predicted nuclease
LLLTCKIGNKKYTAFDLPKNEFRKLSRKGVLKCPITDLPVVYKCGKIKIPHFAYKDKPEGDLGYWENETKEHFVGKALLYKWLKKDKLIKNLELEKYIPETKQIADLYFEKFGKKYVIEFQCSNTTIERYEERVFLYSTLDINDVWIFGKEKFNMGQMTKSNDFKLKAIEKRELNRKGEIYHFNPFKRHITKSFYYKDKPIIFKDKLNTKSDNFFIHKGKIYLPNEIELEWKELLDAFLNKCKIKYEKEKLYNKWLYKFNEINELDTILKIPLYKIHNAENIHYMKLFKKCLINKLHDVNIIITNNDEFGVFEGIFGLCWNYSVTSNIGLNKESLFEKEVDLIKYIYDKKMSGQKEIYIYIPNYFCNLSSTDIYKTDRGLKLIKLLNFADDIFIDKKDWRGE